CPRRRGRGRGRNGCRGLRDSGEDIAFQDLAALAGTLHGGGIEAVIGGDLGGGGRRGHRGGRGGRGNGGGRGTLRRRWLRWRRRNRLGFGLGKRRECGVPDLAEQRPGADR